MSCRKPTNAFVEFISDYKKEIKIGLTILIIILAIVTICVYAIPGCNRYATSLWFNAVGGDWIIVQISYDGTPINCWKLEDVSVTNESQSDGIAWKNSDGNMMHIAGWYNWTQVYNDNFAAAAKSLGVELDKIQNGKYLP